MPPFKPLFEIIRKRLDLGACAALALAVPFAIPFLPTGLPATADAEIHFHRIVSAAVDIQAGYLWPRWSPYLHQGFGYPIHNFYAPGVHIIGALIFLLAHIDPAIILKLIQFAATFLYPLGAYFFCRIFSGKPGAVVAAAAYLYAPFRFNELWVQTNISQFCAMALMPWVMWAIARASAQPDFRRAGLVGLLFGAVVILHHPTAFLFAPFAGLYALALSARRLKLRTVRATLESAARVLLVTGGGLALGLALSAIFWLPALFELQDTQINRLQSGSLSIGANFVSLNELLSGFDVIDRTALALPSLKQAGQLQVVVTVLGLLIFLPSCQTTGSARFHVLGGAIACAFFLFMITPASALLWTRLPIANLIVYPWRLLGIVALMALPGAASIPDLVPLRWHAPIAGLVTGLFFVAILPLLYAPLTFVSSPAPTEVSANRYEARTGNVGLTSGNEYLPRWAVERPLWSGSADTSGLNWFIAVDNPHLPPGTTATAAPHCAHGASCFDVQATEPFALVFHQMYFPGWTAKVGDTTLDTGPTGSSGLLTVNVPAGTSRVTIWYGGTAIQRIGDLVSLLALVATVLLFVFLPHHAENRALAIVPPTVRGADNALALRVILFICGFVVLNQLVILPDTTLFRRQSDPAAPPASHHTQIVFGDTLELLGYDLDSAGGTPGQPIQVVLYWRLLKPTTLSLSAAVHLTGLDDRGDWGGAVSLNPGAYNTTTWPTDRYVVDSYQVHIAPDAPPYVGQLRVSVFQSQDSPPGYKNLSAGDGQTSVVLSTFRVSGSGPVDNSALSASNVNFGDALTLLGYQRYAGPVGQSCIRLRWQARRDHLEDYVVMLHLLDANGNMIKAADAPPVDGQYPTSLWLNGQILDDMHCFATSPDLSALAVGLYRQSDTSRLSAIDSHSVRLPDDSLKLPNG